MPDTKLLPKITYALEIEDPEGEVMKMLKESFVEDKFVGGVKVYAASHGCLFEEIENLEDKGEC